MGIFFVFRKNISCPEYTRKQAFCQPYLTYKKALNHAVQGKPSSVKDSIGIEPKKKKASI